MGYRYAIIGCGRQGTAAAYDLVKFGRADEVVLGDADRGRARRAAARVDGLVDASVTSPTNVDVGQSSTVNMSYVLLYDTHIKERGVPSYVKVLYLPYVVRLHDTTASNIKTFVQYGGGYAWADFLAGEYSLTRQVWLWGDPNSPMNQIFSATFGQPNYTDEISIEIVDSTATESLPAGSQPLTLNNENVTSRGGTLLARFDDGTAAIWLTSFGAVKTQRVASALAVRSYQRFDAGLSASNFSKLIVDWSIFAKGLSFFFITAYPAKVVFSVWDATKIGDATASTMSYFIEATVDSTRVSFEIRHMLPNTVYRIFKTSSGSTSDSTASSGSEGTLTWSSTLTFNEQVQYNIRKDT
jgi:hypothetical protein